MFDFKEMDAEILTATKEVWESQVAEKAGELVPGHYTRILDWSESYVNRGLDKNVYVYALCRTTSPLVACAILEISHALPNSEKPWLKVLSIHLEPALDVAALDTEVSRETLTQLSRITSKSLVECLGLTFEEYPSTQLKVYGAEPITVQYLEAVATTLDGQFGEIQLNSHGQWLVLDKG